MTFVPPTAADLLARYPAFSAVPPATINAMLEDAGLDVGEGWIEAHRRPAILALVAHRLAAEGALVSQDVQDIVGGGVSVDILKAGDHEIRFSDPNKSEVVEATGYARTPYGRRYLALRARSFPAVAVI